jgi:hypothetical protein
MKLWAGFVTHDGTTPMPPCKRPRSLALGLLLSAACADHTTELGPPRDLLDQTSDPGFASAANLCEDSAGDEYLTACILDSEGHIFTVDGTIPVLPPPPPYSLLFHFNYGVEIKVADVDAAGGEPPIRVGAYGAPSNAQGCSDPPESDETKRIAAAVTTVKNGGLRVQVGEAQPIGTQLAVQLEFDHAWLVEKKFPAQAGPSCSGPTCLKDAIVSFAFVARMYIGEEPETAPGVATCKPGV